MDRFPLAVCDHDRIPRANVSQHELSRGEIASKERDVYGRKGHLLVTQAGPPVECCLTPGSDREVRALQPVALDGPEGSHMDADTADNDDEMEAVL
jgi:hypothetical protein